MRGSLLVPALTALSALPLACPQPAWGQGTTTAVPYPEVARLPRPRQLWLQHPAKLGGPLVADEGVGRVFIQHAGRNQLLALDPVTGRSSWSAPLLVGPAEMGFEPADQLAVAEEVVVAWGSRDRPAAFSRKSGKRVWQHQEACPLAATGGPYVVLECPQAEARIDRLKVIRAENGKTVATFAFGNLDRAAVDGRALYVWSYDRRRLRKHALVEGEPTWEIPAPRGEPERMLAAGGVLVWPGRDVQALDGRTGLLLWSRRPPGDHAGPFVEPALHQGRVLLSTEDALVLIEPRTATVEKRYELPPFMRTRQRPGLNGLRSCCRASARCSRRRGGSAQQACWSPGIARAQLRSCSGDRPSVAWTKCWWETPWSPRRASTRS